MVRNIVCLLLFIVFLSHQDAYSYRPFTTEDAGVAKLGEQKIEMGFIGSKQNVYWYNYISFLYGIGLGKSEILVETPYCFNGQEKGLNGIILAAKINILGTDDDTGMLAAKAGYEFPDNCYGASAIATKKFGELVIHSQVGLKRNFGNTVVLFGLGFDYALLHQLSIIIYNFAEYDVDTMYHRIVTGIIFGINNEVALDIAAGYCYANNHNNYKEYFSVAGISFVF
ncbi:MAG: hypothetical protein WBK20_13295 [Spirochaetota bacterium]